MKCMVLLSQNAAAERRGDLLPCLPLHEGVKQIARRINFLSDSGAGKSTEFLDLWPDIAKVLTTIFGPRLGRGVRQSGLTDILGCLYDVEIMRNQMPVPLDSIHEVVAAVYKYCDPPAAFSALVSMLRYQHTNSAHMNDEKSVGMVVDGIIRVSKRANEMPQRDCAPMLYEIQRWCNIGDDGIDVYLKLQQCGQSITDKSGVLPALCSAAHNIQLVCGAEVMQVALRQLPADIGRERLMQMLSKEPCTRTTHIDPVNGADAAVSSLTMTA